MVKEVLRTPYYLIDERVLLKNLKIINYIREHSGTKIVLALKCFSTWAVFDVLQRYMDGTTSSSLYEARLGYEKFGKEVHAYCVGFSADDIKEVTRYADKIIFNSLSQLDAFHKSVSNKQVGVRLNPQLSYSHFDLANPARRYSRLGIIDKQSVMKILPRISGVMFHFNCENDDFSQLSSLLDNIAQTYGDILEKVKWVSFGGGIYFTKKNYPYKKLSAKLKQLSERFRIQIYLEPGESVITQAGELVTKVVDIVHNKIDIAIVDSSTEAHILDLLIYRIPAKLKTSGRGRYRYMIAGRSCLAGDVFGTYSFNSRLRVGSILHIADAAGYTMVKKNWFNGLQMPAIVVKRLNGSVEVVRTFDYKDFVSSLS